MVVFSFGGDVHQLVLFIYLLKSMFTFYYDNLSGLTSLFIHYHHDLGFS